VSETKVINIVENVIGCKWSLLALSLIKQGVSRPGAMVRSVDGLTTKVLNERLTKMVRYGILDKRSYPEVPPRVEYEFTPFGERLVKILEEIEGLQGYYESNS